MPRILKGLLFAAGAGVAMTFGTVLVNRPKNRPAAEPEPETDRLLRIEPLLDRIERMEARVAEQDAEIAVLRSSTGDSERRIAVSLAEQSQSIAALHERAEAADANMQRLIVAIERLCERTPAPAASQPVAAFQEQLDRAMENPQPQKEFAARIIREEKDVRKSRMPFARIFPGLLTLAIWLLNK